MCAGDVGLGLASMEVQGEHGLVDNAMGDMSIASKEGDQDRAVAANVVVEQGERDAPTAGKLGVLGWMKWVGQE